jgi:hypothetical protein
VRPNDQGKRRATTAEDDGIIVKALIQTVELFQTPRGVDPRDYAAYGMVDRVGDGVHCS